MFRPDNGLCQGIKLWLGDNSESKQIDFDPEVPPIDNRSID